MELFLQNSEKKQSNSAKSSATPKKSTSSSNRKSGQVSVKRLCTLLSYTKIMVTVISCFPSMFVCIFAKKNLRFSRLNGVTTGCQVWSNVLNTLNIPKPCFEICGHHYPINDCSCQHLIYRTCNILSEIILLHTLFFMFSSLVM